MIRRYWTFSTRQRKVLSSKTLWKKWTSSTRRWEIAGKKSSKPKSSSSKTKKIFKLFQAKLSWKPGLRNFLKKIRKNLLKISLISPTSKRSTKKLLNSILTEWWTSPCFTTKLYNSWMTFKPATLRKKPTMFLIILCEHLCWKFPSSETCSLMWPPSFRRWTIARTRIRDYQLTLWEREWRRTKD